MSRKLLISVSSFFALALSVAGILAPLPSAAAGHGLTAQSIANATASVQPSQQVTMRSQTSLALLKQASKLGPHVADSKIELTVSLKLRHVAQLKSFLEQVQSPASSAYHQYLTPEQFTKLYGPSEADVQQVVQYLKANGIDVTGVSSNRLLVHIRANTSEYAHAFGIRINDYKLDGRKFYSTADRPKLPRSLSGIVRNVIGLDGGARLQSTSRTKSLDAKQAPHDGVEPPDPSLYQLSPSQFAKAYDWPDLTDEKNAKDVTIALLGYAASGLASNDAPHLFWQAYRLPDHDVNVISVDGDAGSISGLNSSVFALEWTGALAPGADFIAYVGATPSFSTMVDVFNKVVTDNEADIASTSWGEYEDAWGDNASLALTANEILMQGAAQGISFFAAAGLCGSGDCSGKSVAADFPSSSPYVTAGNGTTLTLADIEGNYGSETALNNNADGATGGGISDLFGQPMWQRGPGVPDTGWRMNSEISVNASGFPSYNVYNASGGWVGNYGTAAVPRAAAALFAIAMSRQPNEARLGQSNVLLYNDVAAGNYSSDFRDITTGNNGAFDAGPNWDHPTGWGSPLAKSLISHLGVSGPSGTLKGTVTDAASGAPIEGAQLTVSPGSASRPAGANGKYSMLLPAGDYTVTVSEYGYQDGTASVSISDGNTTTQDIALKAAPTAILSGRVTDASGHGYGLYAKVSITSHGFGRVAEVWTDPKTGKYSVKLPKGFDYNLSVAAAFEGYQTDSATVSLPDDTSKNFALPVIAACTAPGYAFNNGGFGEDFNGANFPPTGWTTVDGISGGGALEWKLNTDWHNISGTPDDNWTGGTGTAADANSGDLGFGNGGAYDTSLVTPALPVSTLPADPILMYKADFGNPISYGAQGNLDLDISTDGGASWTTVTHWDDQHGGLYALPGETVHMRIGSYLPASGSAKLRWRYYDLTGNLDYYAQVDDVVIGACQPIAGGLITGRVTDANTGDGLMGARVADDAGASGFALANSADADLPVGTYVFFATAGKHTLTASAAPYAPASAKVNVKKDGITTQDFALDSGQLVSDTDQIDADVTVGERKSKTVIIKNTGDAPAPFTVLTVDEPTPATSTGGEAARVPLQIVKGDFSPGSEAWLRSQGKWSLPPALRSRAATVPHAAPWRDIAPLPDPISTPTGAAGPGGVVYSIGGFDETLNQNTSTIYAYDPKANSWSPVANMGIPRGGVAAAFVGGKLYIANGFVGYQQTSSLAIYDPDTGKVGYGKTNPLSTQGNSAAVGLNGKLYVVGGCSDETCLTPQKAVQVYDPAANSWSSAPDYPHPVAALACGAIHGRLYCAGGHGTGYEDYTDGYVYNPADSDAGWKPIADMPIPNGGLWGMAHAVGEGKLLISGGVTAHSSEVTNAGYAYDPATNRWSALPNANHVVYRGGSACGFYRFGGYDVNDAQVASAEVLPGYTPCGGAKPIPYLTAAPASGTIPAGGTRKITLTWDGAGQEAFTTSEGYFKVTATTPYSRPVVAVKTHWIAQPVSLKLSGEASAQSVSKGSGVSYRLTVNNAKADGQGEATDTMLAYALPAGMNYVGANGDASCAAPATGFAPAPASAGGTITCDLGTIAEGGSKTVTIAVKATKAGTITNHFVVRSRESGDSDRTTLDLNTTVLGQADMGIGVSGGALDKGKPGNITASVSNAGPDMATDVKVKFTGDGNLELSGASADRGSCAAFGGAVICDLGDVESGAKAGITLNVKGLKAGTASVRAHVTTSADDSDTDNNVATASVTIKKSGGGGGGGAFGWLALLGMIALAIGSLYIRQRRQGAFARAALSPSSGEREGMSRHAITFIGSLFALALVLTASLAPSALAAGHRNDARGMTQSGIENAIANSAPSHYVSLKAQTNAALLKQAKALGPHAVDSHIELTISLKLHNQARLKSFLEEVQNPASPLYRHFLTPQQFTERFGPSKADVTRVVDFLKQNHIEVKAVSSNRLLLHTEGKTSAYENALGIRINDYALNGRQFFSTADRPRLPRAVAGVVHNVIGLDNAVRVHPHSHFKPLSGRLAPHGTGAAIEAPPPSLTALSPLQIAKAYDWPDITDTDNGAGVTIAILTYSSSGLASNDAPHTFWDAYDLPDHTVNVIPVDGDAGDVSGMGETLLDIELSGAMAPGADLEAYSGATPTLATTLHVMNRMVTDDNAAVVTTSWGLYEAGWGDLAETINDVLKEAAAQGISLFAAAGDNGALDNGPGDNNADFPSSSPFVTAANGTELTISDTTGTYSDEHAWASTGGAVSQLFVQPDWQKGPGVPDTGWRMNSDLSLNGGPLHPYAIYENGGWYGVYGTSAVAPALAGMYAIGVSQQTKGARLGQSNSLLYNDVAAGNQAGDFRDVTTGCNGKLPDGSDSCAAKDWDHPTGWGSPKATNLLAHLGIHGPAGILQGTVTDAASGEPVGGASISIDPGDIQLVSADDGSYSTVLAVGDYTVSVESFGYKKGTASVSIGKDNKTTQDFPLEAKPAATLSGKVSDGSGHGYGLYALVTITSPGFGQVASVWTDPATGKYSTKLPEEFDYTVSVAPSIDGYQSDSATLTLSGDTTKNFPLPVTLACAAPGYEFKTGGFGEDFNGSWPPAGWKVTNDVEGATIVWNTNAHWNQDNWTGGTGLAAHSWGRGPNMQNGTHDTSLISPPIAVSSLPPAPVLVYKANFFAFNHKDSLNLDISFDDGNNWTTLLHWNEQHGGKPGLPFHVPGEDVRVPLSSVIPAGTATFKLRWRDYEDYTLGGGSAQIDDVAIGACQPVAGGLVMGQVTDANTGKPIVGAQVTDDQGEGSAVVTNAQDSNLPASFYLFFASKGKRTLSAIQGHYSTARKTVSVDTDGVVVQDFALKTGELAANPGQLDLHVTANKSKTVTLTVRNTGSGAVDYKLYGVNVAPPTTTAGARNMRTISIPLENPRFATASLPWIRAHSKNANGPLAMAARAPAAGSAAWAGLADFPVAIGDNTAARSPVTGKVYEMGGVSPDGLLAAAFVYDPVTDLWALIAPAPVPREAPVSAFVNGKYYVFDGWGSDGNPIAETDIYDPATDHWSTGKPNPVPAGGGAAIGVVDGKIYIMGGCVNGACPAGLQSVQVYDPVSDSWSSAVDYPVEALFAACGGVDGKLYCAGGIKSPQYGQGGERAGYAYDPATDKWSPIADIPLVGGLGGSFYTAANGKLLMASGVSGLELTNEGAAYDPETDSWSMLPNMAETVMRGAGACGMYAIGGLNGSMTTVTPHAAVLPGYTICGTSPSIPWLAITPAAGSALAPSGTKEVALTIDGADQKAFTTSKVYIEVAGNTPYTPVVVPLTVTWDARPVNLSLTGSASPDRIKKGAELTYDLTVENAKADGGGAASETTLSYALPKGVSYVAANGDASCTAPSDGSSQTPAAASSAPGTLVCDFGTIAQGASKRVTIAVKAEQAGTFKSHFEVASRESNNSGKNTLDLKTTVVGSANMGVSLSDATLKKGKSGAIPVTVSNAGPDTATDVKLKLRAGAGVTLENGNADCSAAGDNGYECDLGDMASGQSVALDLSATGRKAGSTSITAQVTTSAEDPNPDNDVASANVTVKANGGGGGGAFGGLALILLLALAFSGATLRRRHG
jgi:subtilase family serine protease/N-acetylneuraminic acid mutarotase